MDAVSIGLLLVIMGAILIVVEIATPGFFIALPGTIAILYGIALILFPWLLETWWGPWVLLSLIFPIGLITFYIYRRLSPPSPPITESYEGLIGKRGIVIETVKPGSLEGKIRIGSTIWSATSDQIIKPGKYAVVVGVEGVHLVVKPVSNHD